MLTAISDTRPEAEPEDGEALDPSETALDAGLLLELEPAVGAGGGDGDGGQSLPKHGHAQTVFGVGDGDQGVAGGNSLGAMGALSGTLPDLALPIDDAVLRTGGDTSGLTAFAAAPAASDGEAAASSSSADRGSSAGAAERAASSRSARCRWQSASSRSPAGAIAPMATQRWRQRPTSARASRRKVASCRSPTYRWKMAAPRRFASSTARGRTRRTPERLRRQSRRSDEDASEVQEHLRTHVFGDGVVHARRGVPFFHLPTATLT